ncbi:MAG: hypothetical protein IMY71_03710 [Bacteroidetes bacterium]|nr:hypothetical protein [Bacteroidota bacterium]
MMKTLKKTAIILAVLVIAGCIPSLHPLYTGDDLVFNPELIGEWYDNDDPEQTWEFTRDGENAYNLKHTDFSHVTKELDTGEFTNDTIWFTGKFDIHLIKLGGNYFMDFYPGNNNQLEINELLELHLFPVHTFAKVQFMENEVRIFQVDPDWIKTVIEEKKIRIKHEMIDDAIILTASTEELQKFFTKYAEEDRAFIDPIVLKRLGN